MPSKQNQRGGALLMVLWLSAALSAIAFSVAISVRSEIDRTSTSVEGLRAYYMACGAAERAVNYMLYGPGPRNPLGAPLWWEPGMPLILLPFPDGAAAVEVIPESSRFNVNTISSEDLFKLLLALGLPPDAARQVAQAVLHWRGGGGGTLDTLYLSRTPSFRAPHASVDQLEELMSVMGITPELFYGGYARTPDGGIVPRPGLRDCLSVYSSGAPFDINTVSPAVMLASGVPPAGVEALVNLRRQAPIRAIGAVAPLLGPAVGRFRVGGDQVYTLRATARLRRPDGALSDLRRSVAMTVQLYTKTSPDQFRVLAWQDNAAAPPLFNVWPN
jgi:general secretion pathway protein K